MLVDVVDSVMMGDVVEIVESGTIVVVVVVVVVVVAI